jgi:hypothetical protein
MQTMSAAESSVVRATAGRRRRWRWLFVAGVLAGPIAGWFAWRAWSLLGLPDVGDPFDVASALRPITIAEGENAYAFYAQAHGRLGLVRGSLAPLLFEQHGDWSSVPAELRSFVGANREALDLWRAGSELSKALYHQAPDATIGTILPITQDLGVLARLGLLEASRLESEGDYRGAWEWYRAALRSSRHAGRGFLIQRMVGAAIHARTCERIERWAADPRVDAAMLRRAIADVRAADALTPPLSEALRLEYVILSRDLGEMKYLIEEVPAPGVNRDWLRRSHPRIDQGVGYVQRARVSLSNDAERSRRVLRLLFWNWLAQVDRPAGARAAVAVREPVLVYAADPSAPPAARALAPAVLARAVEGTMLARQAFSGPITKGGPWEGDGPLAREETRRAALFATLAKELERRQAAPRGTGR